MLSRNSTSNSGRRGGLDIEVDAAGVASCVIQSSNGSARTGILNGWKIFLKAD